MNCINEFENARSNYFNLFFHAKSSPQKKKQAVGLKIINNAYYYTDHDKVQY